MMQAIIMNPEGAYVLIGIAARIGSALGLHQWLEGFGLSRPELEHRQRVLWILYTIEKDFSNRVGRPSVVDDEEIDFDIPLTPSNDEKGIHCRSLGDTKFYPFRARCSLARIASRIYRELYATAARVKTTNERLQSISRLDAELQEWKESVPEELRPEHTLQCDPDDRFPIVLLHLQYYNFLVNIHRVNAHHELWASENEQMEVDYTNTPSPESRASPSEGQVTERVNTSYALCLAAARSTLHLSVTYLHNWKDPRNSLIWMAHSYPLSAFLMLFSYIVHRPLDPKVDGDLGLMERTLGCITAIFVAQDRSTLSVIYDLVSNLLAIARDHVEKVRTGTTRECGDVASMTTFHDSEATMAQEFSAIFPQHNIPTEVNSGSIEQLGQQDGNLPSFTGSENLPDIAGVFDENFSIDDPFFFVQDAPWDWSR